MITCTRRLQFCAGHRVYKHGTTCRNLHGHNYVVYLTAIAEDLVGTGLDPLGMVIDFSVLKEKFSKWIDENWDHAFLWFSEDAFMRRIMLAANMVIRWHNEDKLKLFECNFNPTAENMADYLLRKVGPELLEGTGVCLVEVKILETENCAADATL